MRLDQKEFIENWLANKLGKSYNMVNSYAKNRRQASIEILFQIAEILEIEAKDLIERRKNVAK